MIKINSVKSALELFEKAAIKHGECFDEGNYKDGNKADDKVMEAVNYLKKNNQLLMLQKFFTHPSVGPRQSAATVLLPFTEKESISILKK